MFSFFHRKPTITVDCFTDSNLAYEYTPIRKASKSLPEWWKKLPVFKKQNNSFTINEKRNMRSCYGFVELFKQGVFIENWCDSYFHVDDIGVKYHISNRNQNPPIVHDKELYQGGFDKYHHLKLQSPWLFKEKTGIKFIFTGATWLLENYPFIVLPGMIEFKVNRTTAINLMFPKPSINPYEVFLPVGQPIIHVIPLVEDKNVEFKNHLISEMEYLKMNDYTSSISLFGGYKSFARLSKRNEQQEKDSLKCPFR